MADPDYFTTAEFRGLPQMSDTAKYPEAAILDAAANITGIVERETRTSFIPRTVTAEIHDGREANRSGGYVWLRERYPRSVTALTQNGVALTAGELANLVLKYQSLRRRAAGSFTSWLAWEDGVENIAVTYTAGYSATPPKDIKTAAMAGTRFWLLENRADGMNNSRATSQSDNLGGTINLATAGLDRPTGFPTVDAVILGWKRRLHVPGIA